MRISDYAVQARITVFVLTALIVSAGVYCYAILPREAAPEVVIPFVFVSTGYRGVSPEDMETAVTKKIEEQLKGLKNVKQITSTSAEGRSEIQIEFVTGTDIDDAVQKVKDKVDLAKPELPTDLDDEPSVFEVNFSEMPILILALAGPSGQAHLRRLAEDLEEKIEGVPGVLEVNVIGGLEREIHIEVDPGRMAFYNLPFTALQAVVASENSNVSGGSIRTTEGKYQLRLEGEFESVPQVEEIVVATGQDGLPIYLRDLATVQDGFKDRYDDARLDGQDSVNIEVRKRGGENILDIVDAVDRILAREEKTWPVGLTITRLLDESENIRMMVADLENNIASGLLLVIIVVCLAMGLRNAILVSLSIPLSMLIGFIILHALGVTLNMVVLFSLTLALGMLVDNAIVIIENIYRFMQQGVPRLEAAKAATGEVALPIIGSAFTTIAAFTPLLWWDGIMGDFMVYLPTTVIAVLASCLFVALVINPAMAAAIMRVDQNGVPSRAAADIMQGGEHPMLHEGGLVIRTYRHILRAALGLGLPREITARNRPQRYLRHLLPLGTRLCVLFLAGLGLLVCLLFWFWRVGIRTPVEFFPAIDPDRAQVKLEMPEGADLAYCNRVLRSVERRLFGAPGADGAYAQAARPKTHYDAARQPYTSVSDIPDSQNVYVSANALGGENRVSLLFLDMEDRTASSRTRLAEVERRMETVTGAEVTVTEPDHGPPTGAPINIEIVGDEMAVLGRLAAATRNLLTRVPFVRNIRDDFAAGSPTLRVAVDRKRAALLGLNSQDIGFALRAAINGIEISTYRDGDDDFDIIIRFTEDERHAVDTLHQFFLPARDGRLIPLTTVARIEYTGGLGAVRRLDHNRVVTVQADIDTTKTTGDTARQQAERILSGSPFFAVNRVLKPTAAADHKAALAGLVGPDGKKLLSAAQRSEGQAVAALNRFIREHTPGPAALERLCAEFPKTVLGSASPEALQVQLSDPAVRQRCNRLLLELCNREQLQVYVPGLSLPPGYRYRFTGEAQEQQNAEAFLSVAGAVAVGLIFLILVSQFNSLLYPFVILSSVVLSLAGVYLGLGICNMPFGIIMSGVGVISLAGVVVNNAIVLLDYTLQLSKRGLPRDEAIVAAGATRLRPVLLTAATTVLGLIPMATGVSWDFHPSTFGPQWVSETSQYWKSMAVVVIFGLLVATILTLFVVPVLFSLFDDLHQLSVRFQARCAERWQHLWRRTRRWYWLRFWRNHGMDPQTGDPGYRWWKEQEDTGQQR